MKQFNTAKLSKRQLIERIKEALEVLPEEELETRGIRSKVSQISQLRMTPDFHDAYNIAFKLVTNKA